MNQYNHGQLAGTLAKAPEIRELRNGAKSVRLTIRNYPDPNDEPEYQARRRAEQDITVNVFVPASQDASVYESATTGMTATCEFWVESYTYQRDGIERTGQSLNASKVDLAQPSQTDLYDAGNVDNDYPDYDIYDG